MIVNGNDLKRCVERLEEVASHRQGYGERLTFFARVLQLLMDRRSALEARSEIVGAEQARIRLSEGFALLDWMRLIPEVGFCGELYDELLGMISAEGRVSDQALESAAALRRDGGEFQEAVIALFRQGAVAPAEGRTDEATELTGFLLHCSLRPWLEIRALPYRELDIFSDYDQGYCPVCGGGPAMGALRGEEGRRTLLCHRCGFVWPIRRVKCPFCGTTDHEQLGYLKSEEEAAYQVNVCRGCRGYLKTVDTRRFPREISLEAEDLATPHYDVIAVREGYVKKVSNVLGLFR